MKRIEKVWGHEIWWADNDKYLAKILFIKAGASTSFHHHEKKHETLYLQSGRIIMHYGSAYKQKEKFLTQGESVIIIPKFNHSFYAVQDSLLFEVSTPYPKDVSRIFEGWGVRNRQWNQKDRCWADR